MPLLHVRALAHRRPLPLTLIAGIALLLFAPDCAAGILNNDPNATTIGGVQFMSMVTREGGTVTVTYWIDNDNDRPVRVGWNKVAQALDLAADDNLMSSPAPPAPRDQTHWRLSGPVGIADIEPDPGNVFIDGRRVGDKPVQFPSKITSFELLSLLPSAGDSVTLLAALEDPRFDTALRETDPSAPSDVPINDLLVFVSAVSRLSPMLFEYRYSVTNNLPLPVPFVWRSISNELAPGGWSSIVAPGSTLALLDPSGNPLMTSLPPLGNFDLTSFEIDTSGQSWVGGALNPVPEPSHVVLTAMVILVLVLLSSRRKRA